MEKALGGPEEVVPAYRAWLSVSESGDDQVSKEEVAQATQWQKASDLARQAHPIGVRTRSCTAAR